jgi:HPt (histidine-containing phosphotransfer) domain-containing protein
MSPDQPIGPEAALPTMASFRDRARVTNLARVEAIAEALHRLGDGALAEDDRLTASRAAHSLVGSAGTFGFGEASRLGRTLEALLCEVDGTEDTKVRAQRGLGLVAQLRAALTAGTDPG